MVKPGSMAFNAIGSVYMQRLYGHWASALMTVMIEITAFAATYAMMLGYSRIPYAAALDGAFFRWFGALHPTRRFPHRALMLVGVLCSRMDGSSWPMPSEPLCLASPHT